MKRILITSLAGFSLMGFGACSQMGGGASPESYGGVRPSQSLTVAATSVEEAYARGREAQAAGQWRRAADEFRRVLARDPRHLEATNALAVAYAEGGQVDDSLSLFRRAIELAPDAAHVHNNYGYALYRLGRLEEAEGALRRAQTLDPGHERTRQNLALIGEARAQAAAAKSPAAPMVATAPAASAPIAAAAAPAALAMPAAPVTAPPPLAAAPGLNSAADPQLKLVAVEPQVYQLRDDRAGAKAAASSAPGTAAAPTAGAVPTAQAPARLDFAEIVSDGDKALVALRFTPRQLGLEISNGVGVAGLARRTAKQLVKAGLPAVRLTNVARFQEATTVILYRSGHEAAAQALGGALPISVERASSDGLRFDVNVRLVLGHDSAGRILAGLDPVPVLAQTNAAGWRWS